MSLTFYSLTECESLWSRWLFRNPEHLLSESENRLSQLVPSLSSAPGSTCPTPVLRTPCLYPHHVFGSRKPSFVQAALVLTTKFMSSPYSGTFRSLPEALYPLLSTEVTHCCHCCVTSCRQARVLRESPRLPPAPGCVPTPRLHSGRREAPGPRARRVPLPGALSGDGERARVPLGSPSPQRGWLWKPSPQAGSPLPGLLDKALWLVSQQLFDLCQV